MKSVTCYYIMPSFRGENADERHLCQFYHSEAEIPGGLDEVIDLVEKYISYLCKKFLKEYKKTLIEMAGDVKHIEQMTNGNGNIPRISLKEAVELLEYDVQYINTHELGFKTLNSKGEKQLINIFKGPVWITHFDKKSVPFYQAVSKEDSRVTLNADLLMGIGETVGAGERHYANKELLTAIAEHNLSIAEYEWYINMKKVYPLRTAGFGMGIERFILWLCDQNDIRDCQLLPRFNGVNTMP